MLRGVGQPAPLDRRLCPQARTQEALSPVREDVASLRELVIGLTLLIPTLVIGIWPRVAMDLYESSTDALAELLGQHSLVALAQQLNIG